MDVAVFDKDGELIFLLDILLQSCRTVYIYTEQTEVYTERSDEIFKTTGAAAIICDFAFSVNKVNFIVSSTKLPKSGDIPVISRFSVFAADCTFIPFTDIPKNTDILCVMAGLHFICKTDLTKSCHSQNIIQKFKLYP